MKPKFLSIGFLFAVCFYTTATASSDMHSEIQIQFVKTQIELKKEPYFQAYVKLLAYADTALSQNHNALTDFAVPGFCVDPDTWPWYDNQRPVSPESWLGNSFEAMEGIYADPKYGDYAESARTVTYPQHHFAWTFPTLMKPKLAY